MFQMRIIEKFSDSLNFVLTTTGRIYDFAIRMDDFIYILKLEPSISDGDVKLPKLQTPPEIEFRNVSFK